LILNCWGFLDDLMPLGNQPQKYLGKPASLKMSRKNFADGGDLYLGVNDQMKSGRMVQKAICSCTYGGTSILCRQDKQWHLEVCFVMNLMIFGV
jgi:hypothetical protein